MPAHLAFFVKADEAYRRDHGVKHTSETNQHDVTPEDGEKTYYPSGLGLILLGPKALARHRRTIASS